MATAATASERRQPNHATLRIWLLGGFEVEWQGEALSRTVWKRPQARTLLKLLATDREHRLHREQLIELFWPEQPPEIGVGNLRRLLYLARQSLPDAARAAIEQRDEVILLDFTRVWIDADAFERAARMALMDGSMAEMEAALSLYRGELLPEERYAEWTADRREELARLHQQLLLRLAHGLAVEGHTDDAAERLRHLLALDPADETAHRELIRVLAATGNRREALRQYQRCREALVEHLGAVPDAATESLRREIEEDKPAQTLVLLPSAVTRSWRTPMIGRERALELVLLPPIPQHHGGVSNVGVGTLVLVRGEAGVGKTRLAAEAARGAAARGCQVLWGTCSPQAAYGPFVEALDGFAERLTREERARVARDHPELARILPSLEPALDVAPPEVVGDELRLFASVARLLADCATPRPILLVLDDLHNADAASLTLLAYLARLRAKRRNWLVLGTYRIEDVRSGSPLAALEAELSRGGRCRRVDLLRLGRTDCLRLIERVLGESVSDEVGQYVIATSLGNPLFAVELLRSLQASQVLVQSEATWRFAEGVGDTSALPLPDRIKELILARIANLDPDTQELLALMSVMGMTVPVATLRRAADLLGDTPDAFLGALDRAVEARVIEERAGPGAGIAAYSFEHPLFREVIYGRLGAARRMYLHDITARAVEAVQPHDLDALAYHFVQGGDRERSVEYLERAADRARSVHANRQAEQQYRDALALLSEFADEHHLAHIQLKLGITLHLLGRYDEALTFLERAEDGLAAIGDLDGLGRAVAAMARTHVMRSTAAAAVERLERAIVGLAGRVDARVLSDLFDALGRCLIALGRYAESEHVSARASEHIRQHMTDPESRWHMARSELQRANAAYFVRPATEAHEMLLAVMPLIERSGDLELLANALNLTAYSALTAGNLPESCQRYEEALEIAERMADPGRAGRFRCLLGRSLFFFGQGEQGLRIAEEGYAGLAESGPSLYLAFGCHMLGVIYLGMGRWPEARHCFLEVAQVAGENLEAARLAAYRAAQLDLLEGAPVAARERLEPLFDVEARSYDALLVGAHLAWAHAVLAEEDRSVALAEQTVRQARTIESVLCQMEVLCAAGATWIELCRWADAEDVLTEVVTLSRTSSFVWHEAVAHLMLARLRYRQGDRDGADAYGNEGRALLYRLGGENAAQVADAYSSMGG